MVTQMVEEQEVVFLPVDDSEEGSVVDFLVEDNLLMLLWLLLKAMQK
jgi:hypothetical protein